MTSVSSHIVFVLLMLLVHGSANGQNVPEGVILTTTTTTRPKITEISTENTQSLLSQETTTLRSPLTAYTTAATISVGKTSTTKQELKRKSNKKDSKKTSKTKKSLLKNDLKTNDLKHNHRDSKSSLNQLKDKARKSRRKANKLKRKKGQKLNANEKRRERRDKKQRNKAARKKSKVLFKKAKSRLKELKKRMKRKFKLSNRRYMKEFLRNCTMLFKSARREKRLRRMEKKGLVISSTDTESETPPNGFEIVKMMNEFGRDIASMLQTERMKRKEKQEIMPVSTGDIDMEVSVFHTSGFRGYRFPDPASNLNVTDSIHLPAGIFKNATEENGTIISIVYDSFYEMTMEGNDSNSIKSFVNSKIVSTTVTPRPAMDNSNPVEIVLRHLQQPNSTKPECVFWKVNESDLESAHWSSDGCRVFKSNQSHTVCHCNHLTDFAVLFRVSETKEKLTTKHKQALTIVSLVGCLLSAVCLMITVVIFIFLRKLLKSTRNFLHLNLAVALLVANVLFLLSGNAVSNKVLCLSVSVCLYYFFLSAFFWMLGEGIYIWIMVAKMFSENLKAWMYLGIGWGIPFAIVAVSFGVFRYDVVAKDYCWLSIESGAIWTFIGPAILVIVVNLGILTKVLCTAIEHQSDEGRLKVSARLTFLLMPILGLTWLFGLLSMNNETIVFEYLFTLFNSCQGIFIFLCYIVLNSEVKNEYQKWRSKREYMQALPMKTTSSSGATGDRSRSGTQNETAQMII